MDERSTRPSSGRPRMVDVAKRAGVSQSTVSFVLNERPDIPVAPETRARVLAAAAELGFRPNKMAQALRLNASLTYGVVTNGIASEPFAGATLLGIQAASRKAGFVCIVVETSGDPSEGDEAVASMVDRGVDGIIYASPGTDPVHASPYANAIPTVFVNCWPDVPLERPPIAVVLPDEYSGGLALARAVFAAGHRDVAYIGGTRDEWATKRRFRGLGDAAREVGLDPESFPTVWGDYSTRAGYDLSTEVLQKHKPSVLVCGNDRTALGSLMASYESGLRPGHDISITGYDDQSQLAAELHPALTTVAIPFYRMGYEATEILTKGGESRRDPLLVPCELIVRQSLRSV